MKNFILSDVHSFIVPMMKALKDNGFDENNPEHRVIVCGDLFDRGPDTVECYEFAKKMAEQNRFIYVLGNHENLLLEAIEGVLENKIDQVHYQNGTVQTLLDFTKTKIGFHLTLDERNSFLEKVEPLVDFIDKNSVNFYEFSSKDGQKFVCCHGWLPFEYAENTNKKIKDNWREADLNSWEQALWANGMLQWSKGARLKDTTIICGHYHCSWGHSHLDRKLKEFPQKNRVNWAESFKPYRNDGIICITI
jgi:serine/threonine protein phosphatase 1